MTTEPISPAFIPANLVWRRYSVTEMTLHRWCRDERLGFPSPVYIGRMRFWRVAELEAWEAEQAARKPQRELAG